MVEVVVRPTSVIAAEMEFIRDDFTASVFEMMKAESPDLDYDPAMLDLWRASLTESIAAGIEFMNQGMPDGLVPAPPASLAYVRAAAQRGVPLSALVRAHRIVHSQFLEAAIRFVPLVEPAAQVPTIIDLVAGSAAFVDTVAGQLTLAYEQEHDRSVSPGEQGRASDERSDGTGGTRVDAALDYPLDGVHIAAVLWIDETVPMHDVVLSVDRARYTVGAELGAVGGTLMVPTGQREARLWFSVQPSANADLDESRVRAAFESAGIPGRMALGRVEAGQSGFRASLKQAERVKAVAAAGGERLSERVVFYAEIAPIALMAGDLDELRDFVAATLGELACDDEHARRLRDTLRLFLARNRTNFDGSEQTLLQHNIIQAAVVDAIDLCCKPFDDPDAVLKVELALEACRWMAPAVLSAARPTPR